MRKPRHHAIRRPLDLDPLRLLLFDAVNCIASGSLSGLIEPQYADGWSIQWAGHAMTVTYLGDITDYEADKAEALIADKLTGVAASQPVEGVRQWIGGCQGHVTYLPAKPLPDLVERETTGSPAYWYGQRAPVGGRWKR